MIEKGSDTSSCCNYCGWKIPFDLMQKINENAGSLFCEFCGTKIKLSINNSSEKDNRENLEHAKQSMVSENSNWQKSQEYSVRLIIKDEDFPKIFKENLIIVISRLIYIYIRIWEQETNTLASRETITKSSFYNLACKIKPIIDRKVSNNFLGNLHKINIEEFEDWLRLLQKKLHTDESYLNHFKIFLLWLLKIVIKLISEMWEMKNIPTFHSTILKDLKTYDFSFATIEDDIRGGTNDITAKNNIINSDTHFTLNIKEFQGFLTYYIENYNNIYSKRFKNLDLNRNKVVNHQVYIELARKIIQNGQIPCMVYEICDKKKGWIRIGWSSHSPDERMKWYLNKSFSPSLPTDMANIYYEMAKSGSKSQAQARFDMRVRYLFPTKGEALIMEEFLTIFRNRANNPNGYDLTINNEYNKIVGNLFKQGIGGSFPSGSLNPKWSDVPPIPLADAVLEGSEMNELGSLFSVSLRTIRRRFKAYGYGVKGTYDLKDARAFLLKPIIIEGFKKGLNQKDFFENCRSEGIGIFDRFKFVLNKSNDRGSFFRRMLDQIWDTSKHKEARHIVIADYILSVITRPDITPGDAEAELNKFIKFKFRGEFAQICKNEFGIDFRSKRDDIFKPIIEKLALENGNEPKIQLRIAIGLGICKENDPVDIRDRASHWVASYVKRNYGVRPRKLPQILRPGLNVYSSLKQQVFKYMDDNPKAKPMEVKENVESKNIETIRGYVKLWRKENWEKIKPPLNPFDLIPKYIEKLGVDKEIKELTIKFLETFQSKKKIGNRKLKGLFAAALYLACFVKEKPVSKMSLEKSIGVSGVTIRKRIKELIDCIDKSNFSKFPMDLPLKPQVFKYLNNHHSARVMEVINVFSEENEDTILRYYQEWRKKRRLQ